MTSQLVQRVLGYWFEGMVAGKAVPTILLARWFGGKAETDEYLRQEFGETVRQLLYTAELDDQDKAALKTEDKEDDQQEKPDQGTSLLRELQTTAHGTLAAVLLLDQFPRNLYRGSARAFAGDPRALQLAQHAIASGFESAYSLVERGFLYLPFEHSEDCQHQTTSVQKARELVRDARGTAEEALVQGFLRYALDHQAIIERFGRYPHRNAVLGRVSTAEEKAYLESGGARFGQ